MNTPDTFLLERHDWVPNHPHLPVLHWHEVVVNGDIAEQLEQRFSHHGWEPQWRGGIYDYHHYHSTAHEALGCFAGQATVMLGGPGGREVHVRAGDVVLLPAGTGHRCLGASDDFGVVGAYPLQQDWDVCRDAPDAQRLERIRTLPFPPEGPVGGKDYWPRPG